MISSISIEIKKIDKYKMGKDSVSMLILGGFTILAAWILMKDEKDGKTDKYNKKEPVREIKTENQITNKNAHEQGTAGDEQPTIPKVSAIPEPTAAETGQLPPLSEHNLGRTEVHTKKKF